MRSYVCDLHARTYRTCPKAVLGEALHLEGAALEAFVAKQVAAAGWRDAARAPPAPCPLRPLPFQPYPPLKGPVSLRPRPGRCPVRAVASALCLGCFGCFGCFGCLGLCLGVAVPRGRGARARQEGSEGSATKCIRMRARQGSSVEFPLTEDNNPQPAASTETIPYSALATALAT